MSLTDRRRRALEEVESLGADGIVSAHPVTVAWLTGYAGDIETGPSPFALPPIAFVRNGESVLVVSADDADAAAAVGCEVVSYEGYVMFDPKPADRARDALRPLVEGGTWATEPGLLPAAVADLASWADATAALARVRAVKDADEIEHVRAAIALCDAGQTAARKAVAPGMNEFEVWGAVRAAMELAAGERLSISADVLSGERTCEVSGPPVERELRDGDAVLIDLVPRRAGYWGDSCATLCAGEPTVSLRKRHRAAREALERALELVRPGMPAAELDSAIRGPLAYPHHTGHGVGCWYFERPYLAPDSDDVLTEGMVVALEPGSYGDGEGARLEQVVVVRSNGPEILSGHSLDLE